MGHNHIEGGKAFNFLYAFWRQVLTFGDLLGKDGRPSATKLMAFAITVSVLFTAFYKTLTTSEVKIWTWEMFWILFLCNAVMFGRWGFDRFFKVMENKSPT